MAKVEHRLERDTIIEAVAEVRFGKGGDPNASLVPGLVFGALKNEFNAASELPAAKFPAEMIAAHPDLAYQPFRSLEGPSGRLLLGPQAVRLSVARPYPSWEVWSQRIVRAVRACVETNLFGDVERISLKYTNVLDLGSSPADLAQTNLRFEIPDLKLRQSGVQLRFEVEYGGCVAIVSIGTDFTAKVLEPAYEARGILLTVDAILPGPFAGFRDNCVELFKQVHDAEKHVFFALLKDETVAKLKQRIEAK